jgi:hypothetical protein
LTCRADCSIFEASKPLDEPKAAHETERPASETRHAQAHDAPLRLRGDRRLLLLLIA